MYNVRCVISSLLVLLYFINLSQHSFGGYLDSYFYTYNFVPHNFYSLNERRKRDINDDGEENVNEAFRIPSDVEVQNDSIDHQYYIMEVYTNRSDLIPKYYFDVLKLLEKPGSVGNKSHPLLSNSYRRAVAAKIQFDFPFYGHRMRNLTIATGGFCYIGDQSHSWLAATQYIAPLMANFDTQAANSTIMYADDGEKFVIEWSNLQLREQRLVGFFTFQASLHKNGDIWFVYKDIPIAISNISDSHHPVKLGMSDAYLFHHSVPNPNPHASATGSIKRVIYEYHRIEIKPSNVTSNTVVVLRAQPTCIQYKTCEECSNATLKHFNCSWCHSKPKNGGPFCSDQNGLHRRRQHWIEGNCKDNGKITYCNPEDDLTESEEEEKSNEYGEDTDKVTLSPADLDVVTWDSKSSSTLKPAAGFGDGNSQSNGGVVSLTLIMVAVVLVLSWVMYSYYNPHTPSGQFLIRYRPSRWRMPSSHVRYSASVHM